MKEIVNKYGEIINNDRVNGKETNKLCREVRNVSVCIRDISDASKMIEENNLNLQFAIEDFLDRILIMRRNPGNAIKYDTSGVLRPYLKDGKLRYTYNERMHPYLENILELLYKYPDTRQAYLSIWDNKEDCLEFVLERERVPCSIGYHFLVRNEAMNLTYLMRSLNVDTAGYDLFTSSRLLNFVASNVGFPIGSLSLFVSSLHRFEDRG